MLPKSLKQEFKELKEQELEKRNKHEEEVSEPKKASGRNAKKKDKKSK